MANYGANIKLDEKDYIVQNDCKVVEKLNEFLKNAVLTLHI